jgi:imidazolonepropionase-like amidohydrolase
MVAGSDSPWGWYAPGEFVNEIRTLADAGLTNRDAILSGTSGAADSIGVGASAGRLEAGKSADIMVAAGDPTRDVRALWNVLDVFKAGMRVERGVR